MEELSFIREIVRIVFKRKIVVFTITLICTLISAIINFFVLQPVYEAKSQIKIIPIEIRSGINPNTTVIYSGDIKELDSAKKLENKLLGSVLNQIKYPKFDLNDIVNFMNSSVYLEKIMAFQGVDTKKYKYRDNIKATLDNKTGLIQIRVKANEPERALNIKKALISNISEFITENANNMFKASEEIIEQGIEKETKDLEMLKPKLQQIKQTIGSFNNTEKISVDTLNEFENVNNAFILANQALESYQIVKKEFNNIKETNFEKLLNLQEISYDEQPLKPVSPKKTVNITIAFMLGFMVSLVIAFVLEGWDTAGKLNSINR